MQICENLEIRDDSMISMKIQRNLWKSVRTNAKHMCNTHFGQCLDVVQIPEITDAAAAQGAVVLRPAPGPLRPWKSMKSDANILS